METPPPGFKPLESESPFIQRSGRFFMRTEGTPTLGTFIDAVQADADGFADRAFLLTFADFALTDVTQGITLKVSADVLGRARLGDWVEAAVLIRSSADRLIFADAILTAGGAPVLRVHGMFRPVL